MSKIFFWLLVVIGIMAYLMLGADRIGGDPVADRAHLAGTILSIICFIVGVFGLILKINK